MNTFALPILVVLISALTSCAGRVVRFPGPQQSAAIASQTNADGPIPVDPEAPSEVFLEPVDPTLDSSESNLPPNPYSSSDVESLDQSIAEGDSESIHQPEPSPTEAPAFLAERPAGEHFGPVPILIDAPEGSTATYSLDRNDAIEIPMSFVLEDIGPGDHVIEIVVQYPNGNTTTLQHHWTQVPLQTEELSKEKRDSKKRKNKGKSKDKDKDKETGRDREDKEKSSPGHEKKSS